MSFLVVVAALSFHVPSFSARFERVVIRQQEADTARGRIYFVAPGRVYYEVNHPCHQLLSVLGDKMTIYYPERRLAYVGTIESPFTTPLSLQFVTATSPTEVMVKLGFRLTRTWTRGDTAIESWGPRNQKRTSIDEVSFARCGRARTSIEVTGRDGRPIARACFRDHITLVTCELARRVVSERFYDSGHSTIETMTYTDVDTCLKFVDSLARFRLPRGLKPGKLEW